MSNLDFHHAFPEIDKTTQWYLDEIVYCLERYMGMDKEGAYKAVVSSKNLVEALSDDPQFIRTESAFYWAMCIGHGFDSLWWHDKQLWAQHNEYIKERHHPPISE